MAWYKIISVDLYHQFSFLVPLLPLCLVYTMNSFELRTKKKKKEYHVSTSKA